MPPFQKKAAASTPPAEKTVEQLEAEARATAAPTVSLPSELVEEELERATVQRGHSVTDDTGKTHGPGEDVYVTHDEILWLRKAGFVIDPNGPVPVASGIGPTYDNKPEPQRIEAGGQR